MGGVLSLTWGRFRRSRGVGRPLFLLIGVDGRTSIGSSSWVFWVPCTIIFLLVPFLLSPVLGVDVSCGFGVRSISLGGLRMEGDCIP